MGTEEENCPSHIETFNVSICEEQKHFIGLKEDTYFYIHRTCIPLTTFSGILGYLVLVSSWLTFTD